MGMRPAYDDSPRLDVIKEATGGPDELMSSMPGYEYEYEQASACRLRRLPVQCGSDNPDWAGQLEIGAVSQWHPGHSHAST